MAAAISEAPMVENIITHFSDTYEPSGPFGAKGVGEIGLIPTAPAVANALCQLDGHRRQP